jgi:hypothetical protein
MKKLHMEYLSVTNSNWKILLDFLYVLPFVPALKIVETYDAEILGRIDEFRGNFCLTCFCVRNPDQVGSVLILMMLVINDQKTRMYIWIHTQKIMVLEHCYIRIPA